MSWAAEQKAELARQYARISCRRGEPWAAPQPESGPEQLLALMRTIPDGAGHAGWLAALRGNA